jgi:hypothetical protein
MTRDISCYQELLARRQMADSTFKGIGITPGPGRELINKIVARGEELFGCDLTGLAEG